MNSTTPTTLSDMGGGATFFDNLVEVEVAGTVAETEGVFYELGERPA